MSDWRINHEQVSHDLMNGEVIAIHLGTGIYYSLRGAAAEIWQLLGTPVAEQVIVERLCAARQIEQARVEADVRAFVQRLGEEGLVVEDANPGTTAPATERKTSNYEAPQLERFADLQDLLLLDPIHDVGAQGWPHRPERPS